MMQSSLDTEKENHSDLKKSQFAEGQAIFHVQENGD